MNRKWIIPLIAAIAAGIVAYGVARNAVCDRSDVSLDRLQDVSFLTHELQLSDAQAREFGRLHATLGAKLNDCCVRHCAVRARLARALVSETNGTAQADAILAEMCQAYEQSEQATLNHIRGVRALLNPEQKRRFDAMIANCMCGTCSMLGDVCPQER